MTKHVALIAVAVLVAVALPLEAHADWTSALSRNTTKGALRSLQRGEQREIHRELTEEQAEKETQQNTSETDRSDKDAIIASAFEGAKNIIDSTYNAGGINSVIVLIDECYSSKEDYKFSCLILDRYGKSISDIANVSEKNQDGYFFSDKRYNKRIKDNLRSAGMTGNFETYLDVLAGPHVYEGKL